MSKYYDIASLAQEVSAQIVRSETEWTRYLTTSARLYKYPFKEQMLIYAQRPDATACASIETWNERMNCWVNKGAKGIALIDEDSDRNKLKYVFDVSDVHKAVRIGREPNLWVLQEEQKLAVIKQLEKTYGTTNKDHPFEIRLIELANSIAEDFYPELIADLEYVKEGSFLDGLDAQNTEIRVRETLSSSIAFVLLSRCGFDMEEFKNELNFDFIHDFSSVETLSILGNATTDMAQPVLMEIGRTIGVYERNKEKNIAHGEQFATSDENSKKELANDSNKHYNTLMRESEMRNHKNDTNEFADTERGMPHEYNIREERGLLSSESGSEQRNRGDIDEIRADEKELLKGSSQWGLHRNASEGNLERASITDSGTSRAENEPLNSTDEQGRGSNRRAESNRSDDLGNENEQHSTDSRGSSFERVDLQLNSDNVEPGMKKMSGFSIPDLQKTNGLYQQMDLFQSFEEQVGNVIAAEVAIKHIAPFGYAVPEKVIKDILRTGGGRDNNKKRIYAKYTQQKTPEEMTAFLQKEYSTTGKGFIIDGNPVAAWFDETGMKIGYGTSAKKMPLVTLNWMEIEARVRNMIEAGDYVSSNEAFLTDNVEKSRIANHYFFFFRDGMDELPDNLTITRNSYPESIGKLIEQLSNKEGIEHLEELLDRAMHQIETGEKKLRFRSMMSPEELRVELRNLKLEKVEYPLKEELNVIKEDFITQDEIDGRLLGGDGIQHGKFRIYEHFKEGHSSKESIDFLKNEYGTGGSSHALLGSDNGWEDHDAKGIRLRKGNIMAPYAEVLLKWNIVEKRIRELVNEGQYLSQKEQEAYTIYSEERDQKALKKEQEQFEQDSAQVVMKEDLEEESTFGHDFQKLQVDKEVFAPNIAQTVQNPPEPPGLKIDKAGAKNFQIMDDALGVGSAKEKFRSNVNAIKTVGIIEAESRIATSEEQQVLSKYVGWGGLSDAFDDTKSNWAGEYQELKALLSPEEYASARESTLNAHYTKVNIFRYVTEGTFDSYSWQLIENKQKFIGQIMTSKSPVRSCEDIDESALSYAEVKALATGNPYIKEKMDLDIQVSKLKLLKANHTSQKYRLEDNIAKHYPQQIAALKERIEGMKQDIATYQQNKPFDSEAFIMKIGTVQYTDKKDAGVALVAMCKEMTTTNTQIPIGEFMGMKLAVGFDSFNHKFVMNVKGQISHNLELGADPLGNITRISNTLDAMQEQYEDSLQKLGNVEKQLENAKIEVTKPFAQETDLADKFQRLSELNSLLNMDEKGNEGIDMDDSEVAEPKKVEKVIEKPLDRNSLKEKLEVMKEKASGVGIPKEEANKFNTQEMAM